MADPAADPIDPDDILKRSFTSVRRGLDPLEVQRFLLQLAAELRAGRDRERDLHARLEEAEHQVGELTEMAPGRLSSLVGEETARILEAANAAATDIRTRSEESVASLLREAQDQAQRLRQEAGQELDKRKAEASELLAQARRQVEELAQQSRTDAEGEIEAGRQRGREMVIEAQRVRERVLRDLARRRKQLRQQIEQLQAGRERLAAAYDVVRETLDVATEELRVALPEAKVAAEEAALRAAEDEASSEPFEDEMAALVAEAEAAVATADEQGADEEVAGAEQPDPEGPEPETSEPGGSGADAHDEEVRTLASDPEEGRRSTAVRVVRGEVPVDQADGSTGSGDAGEERSEGVADEGSEDQSDERAVIAADLTRSLGRAIKRALSDEQNELLDVVRREEGDVDDVLPEPEGHVERIAAAMIPTLTRAAAAGAELAGSDDVPTSTDLQDMAAELAAELVAPLRERLERCFAESSDPDVLADDLRACYREWRTQRVDPVARRAVRVVLDRGILDPSVP